jgi:CRISPR/Cas system-associated exonuclease Cas4 (RecB family)
MEFLIGLAIIIALSELREWRQANRAKNLNRQVRSFARGLTAVTAELKVLEAQLGLVNEKADRGFKEFAEARVIADEAKAFSERASIDLATIVNEYKVNGVPVGVSRRPDRRNFDMVEGL